MRAFHLSVPVLAGAALCAASGCSPSAVTARHTVSEYRADAVLRHQQMAECANDPGTLGATPDCVNAQQASRLEDTQSLRQLPPIRLPEKKQPTAKDAQGH